MAALYVEEYSDIGSGAGSSSSGARPAQAPQAPSAASQLITITGSPTLSAAFQPTTKLIRMHADTICSYAIGLAPTAVTSANRMVAGQTEFIAVNPGHKISVIANA